MVSFKVLQGFIALLLVVSLCITMIESDDLTVFSESEYGHPGTNYNYYGLMDGESTLSDSSSAGTTSDLMWNFYRQELIRRFSGLFNSLPNKPSYINSQNTVLQLLTDPYDALWDQSQYYLNEGICKYAPNWAPNFTPRSMGVDGEIPSIYRSMTMDKRVPVNVATQAFLRFSKAQTQSYTSPGNEPKSYPWNEVSPSYKLSNFVQWMRTNAAPHLQMSFSISKSATFDPTVESHPWSNKIQKFSNEQNAFVRDYSEFDAPMSDEIKYMDDAIHTQSDSSIFFRRRRRRSPPPPPTPIHITTQTDTFKMDFFSKGVMGIPVTPGDWFNNYDIGQCRNHVANTYFSLPYGKMSLIPAVIWVAYQPSVTLTINEKLMEKIVYQWNNPKVKGIAIGGAIFKNPRHGGVVMSDGEEVSGDTLEILDDVETESNSESNAASFETESILSQNIQSDDQLDAMSDSKFFRRRRRRRYTPPPPPPPPKIVEQVKTIRLTSSSPHPQVLAVTSRVL